MTNLSLNTYKSLISQFVNRKISADQFEQEFISLFRYFRDTNIILADSVSDIISELFTDVDSYCGLAELRSEYDIDEKELLDRAKLSLERLLDYQSD